jgi:hypothetical protein
MNVVLALKPGAHGSSAVGRDVSCCPLICLPALHRRHPDNYEAWHRHSGYFAPGGGARMSVDYLYTFDDQQRNLPMRSVSS